MSFRPAQIQANLEATYKWIEKFEKDLQNMGLERQLGQGKVRLHL